MMKIENAAVLVQVLVALTAVISNVWLCASSAFLRRQGYFIRSFLSIITALSAVMFSLGLVQIARIDILISYLFISIAAWVFSTALQPITSLRYLHLITIGLLMLAAGLSWLPAIAFGLTFFFVATVQKTNWIEDGKSALLKRKNLKRNLFGVAFWITAITAMWTTSFWSLATAPLSNVVNDTLPGGVTAIHPLIVISIFCIATWWIFQTDQDRRSSGHFSFLTALGGVPVTIMVSSYFLNPFKPETSTWLLVYIACSVLLPFTSFYLLETLQLQTSTRVLHWLSVPVITVAFFLDLKPQISHIDSLNSSHRRQTLWAETVMSEYGKTLARPVACLNTQLDDISGDVNAQLCTQMSFRLGGFVSEKYEYWSAATGCSISDAAVSSIFSRATLANMTLILSDPTRTSSMVGCQAFSPSRSNGWLTDLDWSLIRKVDRDGNEVFPSPTKAGS
jgi:hypothetical protein